MDIDSVWRRLLLLVGQIPRMETDDVAGLLDKRLREAVDGYLDLVPAADTAFALKVSVFSSPIQLPAETTIAGSPSA